MAWLAGRQPMSPVRKKFMVTSVPFPLLFVGWGQAKVSLTYSMKLNLAPLNAKLFGLLSYRSSSLSVYSSNLSNLIHIPSFFTIACTTFTTTPFPHNLYLCVSLKPSVHISGKPINLSHSRGVSRRILQSCIVHCWAPVSMVFAIPPPNTPPSRFAGRDRYVD